MSDPFALDRFVMAQDPLWERIGEELRAGAKRTHWMWFVFPQLTALGRSVIARRFGIGSLDEARAYLAHPVLGPRLAQAAAWVNAVEGKTANQIFSSPDDMKFRSSMTLFAAANPAEAEFPRALRKYYGGEPDPATLAWLRG
jgi:uncharacterized protein (DUF1810 family)